eukprot:11370178-Alexandrium_andersonii.AAC.1
MLLCYAVPLWCPHHLRCAIVCSALSASRASGHAFQQMSRVSRMLSSPSPSASSSSAAAAAASVEVMSVSYTHLTLPTICSV